MDTSSVISKYRRIVAMAISSSISALPTMTPRPGSKTLPDLSATGEESRDDEADHGQPEGDGDQPSLVLGHRQGDETARLLDLRQEAEHVPGQADQQENEEHADDGQDPLVHHPQATSRHADFISGAVEDGRARRSGCELPLFQRLETLQLVLVEHDDQTKPDQQAGEQIQGDEPRRVVTGPQSEDQQHHCRNQLQYETEPGNIGRSLVREMIDPHASLSMLVTH